MASHSPPGPDSSLAPPLIGTIVALHVLSLSAFGTRIYTRVKPILRLGYDDYFIAAAVCFDTVTWIALVTSTAYGLGRHNYYVSAADSTQAEKFFFVGQPAFAWALACTKISIACMLFRFQTGICWRNFLYIMIVVQVLTAITNNVFQFTLCKPLSAIWDHTIKDAKCIVAAMHINIIVIAVITILTDVVLSLLPLTFIVRMHLPLREKVALACLMGLGLVASGASMYKTFLAKSYGVTSDTLRDAVGLTLCAIIEIQLGILAACIPSLRQFLEKWLRRLGLLSDNRSTTRTGQRYSSLDENQSHELSKASSSTSRYTSQSPPTQFSEEIVVPSAHVPAPKISTFDNAEIKLTHDQII